MPERFDVTVHPARELRGTVTAQPSKNYTTRYLIAAALSEGTTRVRGVATSDDRHALQECLEVWGARFTAEGPDLLVEGFGGQPRSGQTLNPHNAGAVARFLMALAALTSRTDFVTDHPDSLGRRPHGDLLDALAQLGARVQSDSGRLPVRIEGPVQGEAVRVRASASSQYTSGLIFLAPLLEQGLEIHLEGDIKSPGPLRQTLHTLEVFGVRTEANADLRRIRVPGGQRYRAAEVTVPGDYPGSAALLAAAAIRPGEVTVRNLLEHDLQGEREAVEVLQAMGADLRRDGDAITVRGGRPLRALRRDGDRFTDAVQALTAAAASAQGETTWENVATLRLKECDRISDTRTELLRLGLEARETESSLSVIGTDRLEGGITADGHGDHRMIMMLSLLALRAERPITITGAEHIRKSYPDFFGHLRRLGAQVEVHPRQET
ncbi:3-phosphoshikimate 1-carboxyvinyltransferase [Deinobacterium chartae]|uniref:3-phosphoshikimate 1-carboxyvinyltransferase n=1 Tax=Deinobacterium chartae TaxID=521158 RepID=A0A841HXN7_9DEIO|nr:3-phosphoshikimate 1-carboxyvinyltransferase [Deinobacterium chartae]MBB6097414.1 3-phosphoshikimate 1-carboxyvinyltransferase [Deinobacterium chartae]